ncbi:MAG TPA: AraC family transcriptional regulator [Metabacillus sp.]|nr:AraC family transcriptional regulator [Metabacillus sp.]
MSSYSLYQQELLTNHFHPTVNAYYFKQWETHYMDFHTHNEVEIMYVISGQCVVEAEQDMIQMKKGDIILLDANVPHRLLVQKGSPCRMLNIEFTFIPKKGSFPSIKELTEHSVNLDRFLRLKQPYVVVKDPNEIYHSLKNLVLELDNRGSTQEPMMYLLFSQLLIQLARMIVEKAENDCSDQHQQVNIYVKKAVNYLHQNYDRDIQVKDVALTVSLHPGYLHRIFKQQMNCTIMDYLTKLRIQKAKMLLKETEIPVIEISQYIGVNSRQYFSMLFKKYTGQTPNGYRKLVKKSIQKLNG